MLKFSKSRMQTTLAKKRKPVLITKCLNRIQNLYDVIKMTDNIHLQSSGEGKTSKFMIISNSKESSTRLPLKVIQQMKLRVTKIKLFNCMQSEHFAYPLPPRV